MKALSHLWLLRMAFVSLSFLSPHLVVATLPLGDGDSCVTGTVKLAELRLVGGKTILRTPRETDMEAILEIFQDEETVRFTWFNHKDNPPWTLERVRQTYRGFSEKEAKGLRHDFVIVGPESDRPLGRCAIYRRDDAQENPRVVELGITLNKKVWGQGYAADAIENAMNYVFTETPAEELWFQTEPENTNMLKQYVKLGIAKKLDASDHTPSAEHPHRYHQFRITKEEWLKRK